MKLDKYRTLEMEHVSKPGSIGDSAAETGRLDHLDQLLGNDDRLLGLETFRTETGYVRHADAPASDDKGESWREDDFTSDQALPLYLAYKDKYPHLAKEMKQRIKDNNSRTGNGDVVNPIFLAILLNSKFLLNLMVAGQALIFRFKYRWNDEKNKFEENENSSCDYLNWIHCAVYCNSFVKGMIPKKVLREKVSHYYKDEPNCLWLVELYNRVIDERF